MENIVCMQSQKAMHISIYIFFPISQLGTYTKKMSFTVCKALNFVIFCWCWMSCSSVGCSVWKLLWKDALSLSLSAFVPIFPRLCSSIRVLECRRIDTDTFLSLEPFKVRQGGGRKRRKCFVLICYCFALLLKVIIWHSFQSKTPAVVMFVSN